MFLWLFRQFLVWFQILPLNIRFFKEFHFRLLFIKPVVWLQLTWSNIIKLNLNFSPKIFYIFKTLLNTTTEVSHTNFSLKIFWNIWPCNFRLHPQIFCPQEECPRPHLFPINFWSSSYGDTKKISVYYNWFFIMKLLPTYAKLPLHHQ